MRKYRLFIVYLALFAAGLLGLMFILKYLPAYSSDFVKENGIVETLGAYLFLAAGLFSVYLSFQSQKERLLLGLLSIAGFIFFLDEISFGRAYFSYGAPRIMKIRVDAVHDLFEVAFVYAVNSPYINREMVLLFLAIAGLFVTVLMRSFLKRVLFGTAGPYLWTVGILFAGAIYIDLDVTFFTTISVAMSALEEYLEMSAALGMVFLCLHLFIEHRNSKENPEVLGDR